VQQLNQWIGDTWNEALQEEIQKPYFRRLRDFVKKERLGDLPIYPSSGHVFTALKETPLDKVRVVIIGQDPYHGEGQAHGLAFSVQPGIPIPPSLRNIYKELEADLGFTPPDHGCLLSWARDGVLLLNSTLTVRRGEAHSHRGYGWESFTRAICCAVAQREHPCVFLLWGRAAQEMCLPLLKGLEHHCVLQSAHPSPLSASRFLGCRHFSKANEALVSWGEEPIRWDIPPLSSIDEETLPSKSDLPVQAG